MVKLDTILKKHFLFYKAIGSQKNPDMERKVKAYEMNKWKSRGTNKHESVAERYYFWFLKYACLYTSRGIEARRKQTIGKCKLQQNKVYFY